jgi:hypothetical protein
MGWNITNLYTSRKAMIWFEWRQSDQCEFSTSVKLARINEVHLHETYSKVKTDKCRSDVFPIPNGLKQDALLPLLLKKALQKSKTTQWEWNRKGLISLCSTLLMIIYEIRGVQIFWKLETISKF